MAIHDPNNDFNGDGRSDILWRHVSGEVYTWISNASGGYADHSVYSRTQVPLNWHVAGIGDFDGDNKDDVLWRQDNGIVSTWLGQVNGGFSNNYLASAIGVSPDWHIKGIGDFDGDGKDDIIWRDDGGLLVTWLGKAGGGFSDNYVNSVVNVPTNWQIEGIGDFDGDGKDDILWRNEVGLLTDWLGQANGGFSNNYANLAADVPLEWQVDSIGDFDGDGRDDILWRHDTGVVTNWLAQDHAGFVNNYHNSVSAVPLDRQVAEIGDFNGDGRDDLLWRGDNGDIINWAGQEDGGFTYNPSYSMFGGQSPLWQIQGESLL